MEQYNNNNYYQQPYQQPVYQQPYQTVPNMPVQEIPEITECADRAFSRALAAFILTFVPFLSWTFIFSLIELSLVKKSKRAIARAQQLCDFYGTQMPGKIKAAKAFGIIAKVIAIIVLVPWCIALVGALILLVGLVLETL